MKQIPLTFWGTTKLFALVDDEDFEWLSKFNWHVKDTRKSVLYARTCIDGKFIEMHRLLFPDELNTIDHKNGNGLDNQKSNLRPATRKEQSRNRKNRRNSKSKFKGVTSISGTDKWKATITTDFGRIYLGSFETEIEAAKAYNKAALEHHGEFARLNEFDEPLSEAETK